LGALAKLTTTGFHPVDWITIERHLESQV